MGPKMLPTIWGTYMKFVTKYQISAINSGWEKCDEKCAYIRKKRNKFINQIRAPGGHIQITIMIDTQQQYIKLNIRGEISIIVVQAHVQYV